ncbi:hypothetical protein U1Q18_044770 [Sarracenia purpurea var. burkii]
MAWALANAARNQATSQAKNVLPRKRPAHPNTTPKDQTLLTADTPYSAAAPLYQQSVVKAQQRIELGHHAAFNQAAERKASERKGMSQINAREGLDGQYSRSVDIPGNQILEPGYFAMIEQLGIHNGFPRFLDFKFAEHLRLLINPREAEKRHIFEAGRRACEDMNDALSHNWETFPSTVRSPYWDAESKAVWEEKMDKLEARIAQSQRPGGKVCVKKAPLWEIAQA